MSGSHGEGNMGDSNGEAAANGSDGGRTTRVLIEREL